mmetsp:Transcript_38136/g.49209  ORF Transcript_38136/g.49209 Transcript_38136/m.49209 type:complete len:80 (+) Transcript_38136:134-373(+)
MNLSKSLLMFLGLLICLTHVVAREGRTQNVEERATDPYRRSYIYFSVSCFMISCFCFGIAAVTKRIGDVHANRPPMFAV